jgi:hypothetical protein
MSELKIAMTLLGVDQWYRVWINGIWDLPCHDSWLVTVLIKNACAHSCMQCVTTCNVLITIACAHMFMQCVIACNVSNTIANMCMHCVTTCNVLITVSCAHSCMQRVEMTCRWYFWSPFSHCPATLSSFLTFFQDLWRTLWWRKGCVRLVGSHA